jgi:uncharacterized membrane protein YbhN (UPF0104 family)
MAQLLMTIVVVGGLAAFGVGDVPLPDPARVAMWAIVGVLVLVVAAAVGRRVPAVRRGLTALRRGMGEVAAHARQRPLRIASGLAASAALTLAHVTAFASCLAAVGGHVPILTLTAIYLAGAGAGSLVPTPAGVGPVEVTMVGGLIAAGVAGDTATAAVLLTRVITVWLLAPPGWLALRSLRRRRLL